jgi:carboxyl-terminal processing protease
MKLLTKILRTLAVLSLLSATNAFAQQPAPSPITVVSAANSGEQKRKETFELVWETVNKHFYDPNFNGVDWKAVHDRYAPQVARVRSDAELYVLLQLMINELRQSHLWIIPPEAIPKVKKSKAEQLSPADETGQQPDEEPEEETALDLIKEELADKLSTGIGIDVRVVNRTVVITRVTPSSPAARAGLRPGFVIKSVNGKTAAQALAELEYHRVFRDIIRPILPTILVADFVNGDGSEVVDLTYLDGRNLVRRARLVPQKLSGEMSEAIGNLPPLYAEFEAKRLSNRIGYIRFNAFVPAMMQKVCAALRDMRDAPGIIIDLRGNEGGLLGMVSGLGGLLQGYTSVFGTMKTRSGQTPVLVYPQRKPYEGPLVILIDGSTQSAGEMFADGLQASGRAVVVGEVSAGSTLPSAIIKLPTGALFQYAFGNYETNNGVRLEGRGVVPDSIVKLNRPSLLRSGDPQLARALVKLRERIAWSLPKELVVDVKVSALTPLPDRPKIEVGDPPPPPPVKPASSPTSKVGDATRSDDENARLAKQIVSRYIETIGGEATILKIKTRVATGTVELPMDLEGTVEIYEAAPNRSSMIMNLKGFGTIQTTFDRNGSWIQDPVRGYMQLSTQGSTADTFHRELELLRQVNSVRFESKEKVGDEECFVLVETLAGHVINRFYFSVLTGLLVRQNNQYLEDYREIDGLKIPFVARQEGILGRLSTVVRLKEVKHNVAIDESKFAERADCFTKPDQKWSAQK